MMSIGFGLERIGLASLRRPRIAAALLAIVTLIAAFGLSHLRFDGNITAVLPQESESFRNFFDQKTQFRDFSRDVMVVVKSPRLKTASGLEDLRGLALELAIAEGARNAVSIFSLPRINKETGEAEPFMPSALTDDTQAVAALEQLLGALPQAGALFSVDKGMAAIIVTLAAPSDDDAQAFEDYRSIRDAARDVAPADFEIGFTGLTPIGTTIVSALISDQTKLTLVGLALGAGIALLVFRSFAAAAICAVAPAITAIWSLSLFAWFGIPITYLSTVLPTLALILAFADGIMLYHRWQHENSLGGDVRENLRKAIREVGPASSLTSITTVLAFFSFLFAPGDALREFSLLGMAMVAMAFLAVIIGLPVAGLVAIRLKLIRAGRTPKPVFTRVGPLFSGALEGRSKLIAISGAIVAIGLAVAHAYVRAEYRITDYLPHDSATRAVEEDANTVFGGRAQLFAVVPAVEGEPGLSRANLERLGAVETVLSEVFGAGRVYSLNTIAAGITNEAALARLREQAEAAGDTVSTAYGSADGKRLLVSVRTDSSQSIAQTLTQIDAVRAKLDGLSFGKEVVVTGFDVLMAREFTHLIEQLRSSLLIAIFLGVVVIGIATRSWLLGLAALTPNLIPIFSVETIVWLRGGGINMSEVVALTIAFGIAIDNAVHVVNTYLNHRSAGLDERLALSRSLAEVAPALLASTVILCASSMVTQISILPMIPVLGRLMIATLAIALLSNLFILPANIRFLQWITRMRQEGTA